MDPKKVLSIVLLSPLHVKIPIQSNKNAVTAASFQSFGMICRKPLLAFFVCFLLGASIDSWRQLLLWFHPNLNQKNAVMESMRS